MGNSQSGFFINHFKTKNYVQTIIFLHGLNFGNLIKQISILTILLYSPFTAISQNITCANDLFFNNLLQTNPASFDLMELQMQLIQQQLNDPANPPANGSVTIPVLVHVIHKGESVGNGTNISYAQIESGIIELNNVFTNPNGSGANVDILFCLAQRTPENDTFPVINGVRENGVLRADGTGVGGYENVGITEANELDIKSLTLSGSFEYFNIWIVSEIDNNGGDEGVQGFAYFPGVDPSIDGAVVLHNAFGTMGNLKDYTDLNTVAVHEIGHSFALFHTFQGDNDGASCPFESNCSSYDGFSAQGDQCCDTPPHIRTNSICPTGITNSCAGSSSDPNDIYPITDISYVNNYMDYSSQECVNLFTECQKERILCALNGPRNSLTYSLGCMPACDLVDSYFTYTGSDVVELESTILFNNEHTNNSGGTATFSWLLNGVQVATTEDLNHEFIDPGIIRICLDVTTDNCTNRFCDQIRVLGPNACLNTTLGECEHLLNGDLSQINFIPETQNEMYRSFFATHNVEPFPGFRVCNWKQKYRSSPDYMIHTGVPMVGIAFHESLIIENPLNLMAGEKYKISFDYILNYTTGANDADITALLTTSNEPDFPEVDDQVIGYIKDLSFNYSTNDINNLSFNLSDFKSYESPEFTYQISDGNYLYFKVSNANSGEPSTSYAIIKNISIDRCCEPQADFIYDGSCTCMAFAGINEGDEGVFNWDFGDGTTYVGQFPPIHTFPHEGIYTVCLSINCENEQLGDLYCEDILVPLGDDCNDCLPGESTDAIACNAGESYETEVCFNIPDGLTPCNGGSEPFIFSDNTSAVLNNWEPIDGSPIGDEYCVSLNMTPDPLGDFETNGETIYLHLCDAQGNLLCFSSVVRPIQCDNCEEISIPSAAVCNELQSNNQVNVYEGTVNITVDDGVSYCGESSSSTAGFSLTNNPVPDINNNVVIDYSITTNGLPSNPSFATIPFCSESGEIICYRITILPELCPIDPDDCVATWSPKEVTCTYIENGMNVFELDMDFDFVDYNICDDGLHVSISGGGLAEVTGSSSQQNGNGTFNLNLQFNILMPIGFDNSQTYDLQLYLCDEEGNLVCFYIPVDFIICGEGNGQSRFVDEVNIHENFEVLSGNDEQYFIYPNPVSNHLTIRLNSTLLTDNKELKYKIMAYSGKQLKMGYIHNDNQVIDVSNLQNGLYVIQLSAPDSISRIQKFVIIK